MGLDYKQSLFFLGPPEQNARDTQMTTRVTERLPPWFLASLSRLRRSTLVRACTPLTKSEEKEILLAVYNGIQTRNTGEMIMGSNPVFRLVFHNSSLN